MRGVILAILRGYWIGMKFIIDSKRKCAMGDFIRRRAWIVGCTTSHADHMCLEVVVDFRYISFSFSEAWLGTSIYWW